MVGAVSTIGTHATVLHEKTLFYQLSTVGTCNQFILGGVFDRTVFIMDTHLAVREIKFVGDCLSELFDSLRCRFLVGVHCVNDGVLVPIRESHPDVGHIQSSAALTASTLCRQHGLYFHFFEGV